MEFSFSRRCYRLLLRLYPGSFREAYGSEMEKACVAALRVQRDKWGRLGIGFGWTRLLLDTIWHASLLRLRGGSFDEGSQARRLNRLGRGWRSLREDTRFAVRHLRRNRAFTVTAVATLALGIGLNTAVFGAVYSLLLRPLPGVENPDGLVHVYRTRGRGFDFLPSSIPLFRDLQAEEGAFEGVAAWAFSSLSANAGDRPERVLAQIVSEDFFEILAVSMLQGRGFVGVEGGGGPEERVVVVSERYWRRRLGGVPGVVGRTLGINGAQWEIIGVAPGGFRGPIPVFAPDLWAPLSLHPELIRGGDQSGNRGNNFLELIARVEPGLGTGRVEEWAMQFANRLQEAYPEFHSDIGFRIHPQQDAGLHPSIRNAQAGLSGVLMGVVSLLLVVACVNVAGLFAAKAQFRRKEVAIRLSLGSPRRRLVSQFLLESLLLSLLAGLLGFFLALATVDVMNRVQVPFDWVMDWNITLDGPVLAFNLGVTLITSLIFGLAPALRSSKPALVPSLKGGPTPESWKGNRSGRLLVGVQVAVSTVLLVCAGLFAKNLKNAMAMDTGFRQTDLALATLDPGFQGYDRGEALEIFSVLMERARHVPGVESVALGKYLPLGVDGAQRLVEIPGYDPSRDESMNIQQNIVSAEYFSAMGIPIVEGRGFLASGEGEESTAAVVNRRFADRFWPGESPIGKAFEAGGRGWEVVGVVPTGKYRTLGEEPLAFMYFPWPTLRSDEMTMHLGTAVDPATILPVLRREVEAVAPGLPVNDLKTMEEHLSFALLPARLGAILLGLFGAICLFLLSVGIHGVVAYSVSRRTREVGIRVAIGADPRGATALVLGEEARVVMMGVLVGLAVALASSGLVENLLYSGEALDLVVWVGAPFFLVMVAGGASYLPARKAARINPAQALREE